LTTLELDRNPITHIETRFVAGLHSLKTLDLSYILDTEPIVKGNFFRDVPFLQTLKLRSTPALARNIMNSQETLTAFYNLKVRFTS
jgi:Leucine-rich repeat (LRR) protein